MKKRAAIYVRVSSERQAEGVSPDAQEADCRELCNRKGYEVEVVFRDIEKYRVGKRMVEPSGTRADRPGLKLMLAAAREGRIDMIVAWREDRLYRGYRPMLDVLDMLDDTGIDIELAKESFDKRLAPVKAWAARMELDSKHDRYMMGVAGKLESGKPRKSNAPYGYSWANDSLVPNEEAEWVASIWRWFGDNITVTEIRRRLINLGARQRQSVSRPWWTGNIYKMLRHEFYYTGIMHTQWAGKSYETHIIPIVDLETAQQVKSRLEKYNHYPAGNIRHLALAAGLAYCKACNSKMKLQGHRSKGKRYAYYRCRMEYNTGESEQDCCRNVKVDTVDDELWRRIWQLIGEPGRLEQAIKQRVQELQVEEVVVEKDVARLEQNLGELSMERQRVITWARKGIIGEDDLAQQLLGLDNQYKSLQHELMNMRLLTGDRANRLLALADAFRLQVQAGQDAINDEPATLEASERQLAFRRQLIEAIVSRVDVMPDKTIEIYLSLDFNSEMFVDHFPPMR